MEEHWGESVRLDWAPALFLILCQTQDGLTLTAVELAATSHLPGFVPVWQSPSSLLSDLIQLDLSQVRLDASACKMLRQWFMIKREDCFLDDCFIFGSSPLIISRQAGMWLSYKQILVKAPLCSAQAAPCSDKLAKQKRFLLEAEWEASVCQSSWAAEKSAGISATGGPDIAKRIY